VIKLNTDGIFLAGEGVGGWGFIGRDADGDVCISVSGRIQYAQDALQTEAEARIQAISCAQQRGIQKHSNGD
jgi:ribonuclease HI